MKLFTKQLLSVVLSLVFCVSIVASVPFSASAAYEAYFLDGTPATEATFILDPGHGGEDPGALGPADENGNPREEDDDNLGLALKVAAALEAKGHTVALTRITDETVSLEDRSNMANAGHYMIFCSLHRNSFSNPAANGAEVYYWNNLSADSDSAKIATAVLNNLLKTSSEITNRGVKTANYSVLRNTATNAILVETLFISCESDNEIFDTYNDELASNIANGLCEALQYSTPDYMLNDTYLPVDLGESFVASIQHISTGLILTNDGNLNVAAEAATLSDGQLWTFEKTSLKNAYKLTSKLDGKCLDIAASATDDGTNVMVWDDNGLDCQRYYFYDVNGVYYIRPVHCTNGRVIDVSSANNNAQIWNFGETNVQQQFRIVTPGETLGKLELTAESTYTLDSSMVSSVKCNTTAETLAANFKNADVKVTNAEGVELEASALAGTGCVVSASDTDETATVIVLGDVDGDGELSSTDYLRIKSYFLGTLSLEGVYFTAADVDASENIDSTDYLRLKSHFLGLIDIYA